MGAAGGGRGSMGGAGGPGGRGRGGPGADGGAGGPGGRGGGKAMAEAHRTLAVVNYGVMDKAKYWAVTCLGGTKKGRLWITFVVAVQKATGPQS